MVLLCDWNLLVHASRHFAHAHMQPPSYPPCELCSWCSYSLGNLRSAILRFAQHVDDMAVAATMGSIGAIWFVTAGYGLERCIESLKYFKLVKYQ
jgi:hypothetical protein